MKKLTIQEFRNRYPDDDACLHRLFEIRYTDMKICPDCLNETTFNRVSHRRSYQCQCCGYQVYPTANTIFHKTTTPLTSWFYAIYLHTITRNGIAAKSLERQLSVCYKTALRMAHLIKILMASNEGVKMNGIVEIDETYIGGQTRNKHAWQRKILNANGTGQINKIGVMGIVNRETGEVYTRVVGSAPTGRDLKPIIYQNVEQGATVVTDGFGGYAGLKKDYDHVIVNHEKGEYVTGSYHTNTIEGYWAILKRQIKGTHIHVSKQHLQKYIGEVTFRYEHRKRQDEMVEIILNRVS